MKMDFPSEQFLEDYVIAKIKADGVCPITGESVDLWFRQLEIRGYGVTDVIKVCYEPGWVDISILELKNRQLKEYDLAQLSRYMTGVRRIAKRYKKKVSELQISISGQLAGPFDTQASNFVYLLDNLSNIEVYSVDLEIDSGFSSDAITEGWFNYGEDWKFSRKAIRKIAEKLPESSLSSGIGGF